MTSRRAGIHELADPVHHRNEWCWRKTNHQARKGSSLRKNNRRRPRQLVAGVGNGSRMCPSARPGQYPPRHSPATGGAMEVTTTERERVVYKALQEPTLCAAFQVTAAEHPDRVALRTKGDEFSMT